MLDLEAPAKPIVRRRRSSALQGANRSREMADHFFHQIRDLLEIGVGPIRFEHGELGIVLPGNAFVPEIAIQLEDLVESAHQQPLQVKLRRDPQIQLEPERLVLSPKRFRGRAAGDRL
jgi:hypothetical protein